MRNEGRLFYISKRIIQCKPESFSMLVLFYVAELEILPANAN